MSQHAVPETTLSGAARLLARRVGLRLDPAIRGRLARCVAEEAEARGLDVRVYLAGLDDPDLLQGLLDRVTVQESAFFRDPGQFAALAERILPDLDRPVRIWSAACANGQEPYSLAMTLAESGMKDWRVIASDISTRALARTRHARYMAREMTHVSSERRTRHFRQVGDQWEVVAPLRDRVEVIQHNLVADPPPFDLRTCDVVFCRNVLIYMQQKDVVAFLERLAGSVSPDAWLFLGYSESLWQVTDRFQLVKLGDAFAYKQRNADPRPSPRPSRRRVQRPAPVRPVEVVDVAEVSDIVATGDAAMNARDYQAAIAAYRSWTYLDPDHPLAHLHLGLAMEAAGDSTRARRAFAAARAALDHRDGTTTEVAVEGYVATELVRLLDDKLEAAG